MPYIWPGSMHWLFMHSQKQRGWEWIKRPTFPRHHSGVLQDSTGSWHTCICSHTQPTQSACDLMTTRRVWSSAAGAHTTTRSLWEKVGMSPWGEQLRKGNALYKIQGYSDTLEKACDRVLSTRGMCLFGFRYTESILLTVYRCFWCFYRLSNSKKYCKALNMFFSFST